jgi:hypothetical protein
MPHGPGFYHLGDDSDRGGAIITNGMMGSKSRAPTGFLSTEWCLKLKVRVVRSLMAVGGMVSERVTLWGREEGRG